jgi:hypothetical protein
MRDTVADFSRSNGLSAQSPEAGTRPIEGASLARVRAGTSERRWIKAPARSESRLDEQGTLGLGGDETAGRGTVKCDDLGHWGLASQGVEDRERGPFARSVVVCHPFRTRPSKSRLLMPGPGTGYADVRQIRTAPGGAGVSDVTDFRLRECDATQPLGCYVDSTGSLLALAGLHGRGLREVDECRVGKPWVSADCFDQGEHDARGLGLLEKTAG